MRKKILAVLVLLALIPFGLWVYGNYAILVGKNESSWLVGGMWGEGYFSAAGDDLDAEDVFYLRSLIEGSSRDQELIDYVVKNACYDASWKCSLVMTTASNLMLDEGQLDVGLQGFIGAYERVKGRCSILYESSIIIYHTRKLISEGSVDTKDRATSLLEKLEREGGVVTDLRDLECRNLVRKKPEYFVAYASLVANLMQIAGGKYAYASVYIHSLNKKL